MQTISNALYLLTHLIFITALWSRYKGETDRGQSNVLLKVTLWVWDLGFEPRTMISGNFPFTTTSVIPRLICTGESLGESENFQSQRHTPGQLIHHVKGWGPGIRACGGASGDPKCQNWGTTAPPDRGPCHPSVWEMDYQSVEGETLLFIYFFTIFFICSGFCQETQMYRTVF